MKLSTRAQLLREAKKTIQRINEAEDINALKSEVEGVVEDVITPEIEKIIKDKSFSLDLEKIKSVKIDTKSIISSLPSDAKKAAEEMLRGLKTESIFNVNLSAIASILSKVTSVGKIALKIFPLSTLKVIYTRTKDAATRLADKIISSPTFINVVKKTGILTALTTIAPIVAKASCGCTSEADTTSRAQEMLELEFRRISLMKTVNPGYKKELADSGTIEVFLAIMAFFVVVILIIFIIKKYKKSEN